ncbi:MAG TPA: hypothetical protein VMV04_11650 [Thermodesulfobacteriota bacterium]|nr:hypothetical protein [Thermodesulfobacteriota bacterium]
MPALSSAVKANMKNRAIEKLKEGRKFIDPIMEANGFHWEAGLAGKSSGGYSDSGQYVKGDRKLQLHFRHFLGLVSPSGMVETPRLEAKRSFV